MKVDRKRLLAEAKDAGMFAGGMIVGAQVVRLLSGGAGASRGGAIAPALAVAAGLAVGATMRQRPLRMMGFGMASMGGTLALRGVGLDVLGPGLVPSTPRQNMALKAESGASGDKTADKTAAGLGYTLEDLPEPPVAGVGGGIFINDNGVVCDENGNPVNSLDDGSPVGGFTDGEGEQGGDGALPGIGDVQPAPGVGDMGNVYVEHPDIGSCIPEDGANFPAYSRI